jgi:CRP-like cAMP-binding protein
LPLWRELARITFRAIEPGDGCYRLDKGLLKVMATSKSGEERVVAILGHGAVLGELAMIDRLPWSASVMALRDSVVRSSAVRRTRNASQLILRPNRRC